MDEVLLIENMEIVNSFEHFNEKMVKLIGMTIEQFQKRSDSWINKVITSWTLGKYKLSVTEGKPYILTQIF